jgi:hypothetical protein
MKQQQLESESIEEEQDDCYDYDIEECCGHDYEFLETLPSSSSESYIPKLYVCLHCNHEKVVNHYFGIRD